MSRRSQVADNKERYPKKEESAGKVAASAGTIASGYASAVKYFGAEPSSPAVLEADNFDESGLLHLIASWQGLRAGVSRRFWEPMGGIIRAWSEHGASHGVGDK
jgi:hypothetical protein